MNCDFRSANESFVVRTNTMLGVMFVESRSHVLCFSKGFTLTGAERPA